MNEFRTRIRTMAVALAILSAGAVPMAHAQEVKPPSGLTWTMMKEVVFNSTNFSSTGSETDRKMAQQIWGKEIARDAAGDSNGPYPSFVLISTVPYGDEQLFFSIYSSALQSTCESPPNGRDQTQLYSKCPMRVVKVVPPGKSATQDFPDYCMLFGDSKDNPRVKNHVEFALDNRQGTTYFRTVQYGKIAPECDRAINIKGR